MKQLVAIFEEARPARRYAVLALCIVASTLIVACGGGGGGGSTPQPPVSPPVFVASPTQVLANTVVAAASSAVDDNNIDVHIRVGSTGATEVHAFTFDILLSNSAMITGVQAIAGDALTNTESAAGLADGRIWVGVTRKEATGQAISATKTLVTLRLRVSTTAGSTNLTIQETTPDPDDAALTASETKIPTITFDTANARVTRN